jgi:LacI family transcriptional regulator
MKFGAITINDIARELGISASAVSKALKDSHEISEKTKKLVRECAKRLNYQPNPMARSLKQGNSKALGVIIPTIDNNFFSQVINGIESVAYSKGYNIIMTQTHESYELEVSNTNLLTVRSIDGLLISLSTETSDISHLKKLHEQGLPIVFFDRVSNEIDTHQIIVDNFMGAYEATRHLIHSGYRQIAHITSSVNVSVTSERFKGYEQALKENSIAVKENYIKYCPHGGRDVEEIEKVLHELLNGDDRPDAIFTASDRITTTTLALLHKMKVAIPNDVALLGFTNSQLADVLNPSLTQVFQPAFEMGEKATKMLIGLIESRRPVTEFETVRLPAQLFIRDSTKRK